MNHKMEHVNRNVPRSTPCGTLGPLDKQVQLPLLALHRPECLHDRLKRGQARIRLGIGELPALDLTWVD
jgi:hypothetical protein